jgi:hypothetical protein
MDVVLDGEQNDEQHSHNIVQPDLLINCDPQKLTEASLQGAMILLNGISCTNLTCIKNLK